MKKLGFSDSQLSIPQLLKVQEVMIIYSRSYLCKNWTLNFLFRNLQSRNLLFKLMDPLDNSLNMLDYIMLKIPLIFK